MSISALIEQLNITPQTVEFATVISVIENNYTYQASRFINGDAVNEKGTNEGSCKIFAFAMLNQLSQESTLACFGKYYREDVLQHPTNSDHANIRNFMVSGWEGISFDNNVLTSL